jgi:putative DNA primase/helicase
MVELPPDDKEEWLRQVRERLAREEAEKGKAGNNGKIRPVPPKADPNGHIFRPTIRITAGELARIVNEVDNALAAAGGKLYAYGNKLVQIVAGEIRTTQGREKSLRLSTITPPSLLCQVSVAAAFEKYNAKMEDWIPTDCPTLVAAAYIDRESWQMPTLLGIVTCPTLRPDGSMLCTPGYDEQTGLFFDPGGVTFPAIPEWPTKAQAEAALEALKAPIAKFKFVNAQSRSVALSGFITTVIRRALDTAPMHCFDAPVAGSGKSLLGDIASVIVTGHRAAVSGADNREELEKKLAASLLGGDMVIMLDNMDQPVGGQMLCQMLTQTKVKPRPFGKLKNVEVPSNAMIFCNDNNLVIEGDVIRRALVGRIDPEVERPELREFDFHPVELARKRRTQLVCAALTIVRAGIIARDKPPIVKLGSFERWSELVREPLAWLGEADPVIVMDDTRRADPQLQNLRVMMEAWLKAIFTQMSAQRVAETAQARDLATHNLENPDLHAACLAVARGKAGEIDSSRLGYWLRRNKDRVLALSDGAQYRFAKSDTTTAGLAWWWLERLPTS